MLVLVCLISVSLFAEYLCVSYIVIECETSSELSDQVAEHIKDGYEFQGGVCYTNFDGVSKYMQAMTLIVTY